MKSLRLLVTVTPLMTLLVAASVSNAADTSSTGKSEASKESGHIMMDHSTGDVKAMNRMKDKHVKVHHDGDAPAQSGDGTKDHVMMDHSTGDQKAMNKMNDKHVKIHHEGDAPTVSSDSSSTGHMMMDHSPGDQKAMSRMKDKKIPVHNSGNDSATDDHTAHHASSALSK